VKAYLAIDRRIDGSSQGGLRIVPDPTAEEVIACARAMTLKYAFLGLTWGGAKGALQLPHSLEGLRHEILRELGQKIVSILKSEKWIPRNDMGSTPEDLGNLFAGAGMHIDVSAWRNLSHLYTAWSVFAATVAALRFLGEEVQGKTFVVQGFGNVGSEYARLMDRAGAKLVALSNRKGAIYRQEGIRVGEILQLRKQHGDNFLFEYRKAEFMNPEDLLTLDVDVAVPAARCWAIHETNFEKVKARIIPCAANVAIDRSIEERLFQKGKIVVTDFVANSGGVFGSALQRYLSGAKIWRLVTERFGAKVWQLLQQSASTNKSMAELAIGEANERLLRWKSPRARILSRARRSILEWTPQPIREPLLYWYCSLDRKSFFN
ncbi:MAG: Glu/Leu/Phe/Val dehydrogenase, partial [Deltaproteobacteria bacterium]|nr:Glu/Leu/Phe/Val dehydrogenase [Deltaproteobacteria bacterium]